MSDFTQWPLRPELLEALAGQGISAPTPIQQAALSDILAGRDVLGQNIGKSSLLDLSLIHSRRCRR